MDGVIVKIDKKDKSYSLLLDYIREELNFPKLKSFELFESPDIFYVVAKKEGCTERHRFELENFTTKLKNQFLSLYEKYLADPRYKSNFWNAFVNDKFDFIREEIYLYFKNIFPEANFNLLDKNILNVTFNEDLNIEDISVQVNPKQVNLHSENLLQKIIDNYIENITDIVTKKVKSLNDTSKQRAKTCAINNCINDVLEIVNKKKIFRDWTLFSNFIVSKDNQFKENFNLTKIIDSSAFKKQEYFLYKKLGIKEFRFSYTGDYIDFLVKKVIEHFKDKSIYRIHDLSHINAVNDIYEKYNNSVNLLLFGCDKSDVAKVKYFVTFPDVDTVFVKGELFEGYLNNNYGKYALHVNFSDNYEKVSQSFKYKKASSCIDYFYELLDKYNFKIEFKYGDGLLFGDTFILATFHDTCKGFLLNMPYYKDSVLDWKKKIKEYFSMIEENLKNEYNNKLEKALFNYPLFFGMYLPRAIAEVIQKNPKYITENVIASILRNSSDRFSFNISYTKDCGKFKLFKALEIKDVLEKMVDSELITKQQKIGDFGAYYIYHIGKDIDILSYKYNLSLKEIFSKLKKNFSEFLTDDECFTIFEYFKSKHTHTLNDYLYLVKLIENKGFLCFYRDEVILSFKDCPLEIVELIKMKYKTETDTEIKKTYRLISKMV